MHSGYKSEEDGSKVAEGYDGGQLCHKVPGLRL